MTKSFKVKAIVFDLDGTLVDSARDIVAALDRLLVEQGRPAVGFAAGRAMIGDGARVLIERGFAATGGPAQDIDGALKRWFELYAADIAGHSRPYPGVRETLTEFRRRGLVLAVCTNKADAPSRQLLAELDLASPFAVIVGGDVAHRKPDPRHILDTLAALGVAPGDALMVGDSPNDAKAAQAAGVPVVVVDYGYSHIPVRELGADAVISDFGKLLELVE